VKQVIHDRDGKNARQQKIGCVMSYNEIPILHRAFELARTGEYGRVKDLEKALAAEGYVRSDPHLQSPSVRKQLRGLCRAASAAPSTSGTEADQIGA